MTVPGGIVWLQLVHCHLFKIAITVGLVCGGHDMVTLCCIPQHLSLLEDFIRAMSFQRDQLDNAVV